MAEVEGGPDIVLAFDSSGSYVGSLSLELYESLYARFDASADSEQSTSLHSGSFALETIRLLRRYRPRKASAARALREHATTAVGSGQGVIADLEGPAPPRAAPLIISLDIFSALNTAFSFTSEPYSSPLSVSAPLSTFASAYPRDALFGASGVSAYHTPWTGACFLAPPGHSSDDLRLMIRAAKACAGADPASPFLAVCVLPRKPRADCHRLYTDTSLAIHCHTLATFKPGYFHYGAPEYSFMSPPAARTVPPPLPLPPHSSNDPRPSGSNRFGLDPWSDPELTPAASTAVDIVLVFNGLGLHDFVRRDGLLTLEAALQAHACRTYLASAAFKRCTDAKSVPLPWSHPSFASPAAAGRSDIQAVHASCSRAVLFFTPPMADTLPMVPPRHAAWSMRTIRRLFPLSSCPRDDAAIRPPLPPSMFEPSFVDPMDTSVRGESRGATSPPLSRMPRPPLLPAHTDFDLWAESAARSSIVYTDASQDPNHPDRGIGCGVFSPGSTAIARRARSFFLDFDRFDITLGELTAIHIAVRLADPAVHLCILTDSLVSLRLLLRHATDPSLSEKYAPLLDAILEAIHSRGATTTLQKVRAHMGVWGNTEADNLADIGRRNGDAPPQGCSILPSRPRGPAGLYFTLPAPADAPFDAAVPIADRDAVTAHVRDLHLIHNRELTRGPTRRAPRPSQAGKRLLAAARLPAPPAAGAPAPATARGTAVAMPAAPATMPFALVEPIIFPWSFLPATLAIYTKEPAGCSTRCLPVPAAAGGVASRPLPSGRPSAFAKRTALSIRFGSFSGCQHARKLRGQDASSRCLLCSGVDYPTHSVTDCQDAALNGLVTLRHDAAVHLIAKAIRNGHFGGDCLLLSAGRVYTRGGEPPQCTVPAYLGLPVAYAGRPDMLLITGWNGDPNTTPDRTVCTLLPVEVAYNADSRAQAAALRKYCSYRGVHVPADPAAPPPPIGPTTAAAVLRPLPPSHAGRDLLQELRAIGWKVLGHTDAGSLTLEGRNIAVIILGVTGSVYLNTLATFDACGISPTHARSLVLALSRHAIQQVGSIIGTKFQRLRTVAAQPALTARAFPAGGAPAGGATPQPSTSTAPARPSGRCRPAQALRPRTVIPRSFRAAPVPPPPRDPAANSLHDPRPPPLPSSTRSFDPGGPSRRRAA